MKKIALWLLYSTAFLLPFVYSNFHLTPYVDSKVLFLRWMAFLIILVTTYLFFFDKKEREMLTNRAKSLVSSPISKIIIFSIVSLGISTIFAFDKMVAFFGEMTRAEGFLTLFTLFTFFVFYRLYFDKKEWRTFFVTSLVAMNGIFIVSLYEWLALANRPNAFTGNATFLAGSLIFSLFVGLTLFVQGRQEGNRAVKYWGLFSAIAAMFDIFLTENRATMLGLILACICVAIIVLIRRRDISAKSYVRPSQIFLASLVVLMALVFGTRSAQIWQHIPGVGRLAVTTTTDDTLRSRILFTKESLSNFWTDGGAKRVLFGWGWDNYAFFWTKHYNPLTFYHDTAVADRSHNKFVDMLVMTGVVGLGLYLALWWKAISYAFSKIRENVEKALPYTLFLITYFVFLFATFDLIQTLIGFYAFLAYIEYEKNIA